MSRPDVLAAAIAFFSLGAVFLGSVLVLLFNPRSRGGRWWVVFQAGIMAWLLVQGWALATGDWARLGPYVSGIAHMLAALFLCFAIVTGLCARTRWTLVPLALGLALLPVDLASWERGYGEGILAVWQIGAWVVASVMLWIGERRRARDVDAPRRRLGGLVLALLLVNLPICIVAGFLTGGRLFIYLMPLLMVEVNLLTFVGIRYLQWHDIEVRAARTGELAAAAAEQERLAVLGELSASLAHEIRNPLTGARSLAQRLAEEEVEPEQRRRYAGVILGEMERVERLIANLLGVAKRARPVNGGTAETPLAPLFDDLLLLLSGRAAKAGVRLAAEADGAVASAPREALSQALLNIILNAVAHSPRGEAVEVRARAEGGAVAVTVRDHGPGIPQDERARIWEPFYTRSGGTGLGLAVVRRLAREHGWEVAVDDAPGGGTEFALRVPARPRTQTESA